MCSTYVLLRSPSRKKAFNSSGAPHVTEISVLMRLKQKRAMKFQAVDVLDCLIQHATEPSE